MQEIEKRLDALRREHLRELREWLAIPSISGEARHAADVQAAGAWLAARLERAGCTRVVQHPTAGHPIVHAEWLGAPGQPTLLIHGHYDVHPVDPVSAWTTPPFKPAVREGFVHARGASDAKGQLFAHVCAFAALVAAGDCPVNVKFLVEGEEEIGSPHLAAFLAAHRAELAADAILVSGSTLLSAGQPAIRYGLRGLAQVRVALVGSSRDLHGGSFGGAVINPALALVEMLAQLKDARGRVRIPGFYDRVERPSAVERRSIAGLAHSDTDFKASIGAPQLHGEEGYTTLERLWLRPTLDVSSLAAGSAGPGPTNAIPARAEALISMHLVPDQDRLDVARKLLHYLKKLAPPSVQLEIAELHGGDPWSTQTDQPVMRAASAALARAFGREPVFVRDGRSIPSVAELERTLGAPVAVIGFGLDEDRQHAADERFELERFYRGIRASAYLMRELAAPSGPGER